MKRSYYIYNNGILKRKDNTLQFQNEDGEKRYIPIETVDEIYVMGEMELNTNLINYLSQYGITTHFLITIVTIQVVFIQEKRMFLVNCL